MNTDIFIRTYEGDAKWLRYCLRSLRKFASGFNETIIVCPEGSAHAIQPLAEEFGARFHTCKQLHPDDYVGQQATKMLADTWCNSEFICFVDSDVVFTRPASPADSFRDGKIWMLKTKYSTISCPWQPITESAVGFAVQFEYMRRFPLTYPTRLLPMVRCHIEATHGVPFAQFIRSIPGRCLSEFNVLGALADNLALEEFLWMDTATCALPEAFSKQFWSWGGVTLDIVKQIEETLK